MRAILASVMEDPGPLTTKVLEYQETTKRLAPSARTPDDWAPLAEYVAVEEFGRTGHLLDTQDWPRYTEMLTRWGSGIDRFETTLRRVAELPRRVYLEIEERHHHGGALTVLNSMSVFEFNEDGKICHLDVFVQQAR
jgi:hypothetical protein